MRNPQRGAMRNPVAPGHARQTSDRQPQLAAAGGELAAVAHQLAAIIQLVARRGLGVVPAAIRLGLELDDDVAFAIAVDGGKLTERHRAPPSTDCERCFWSPAWSGRC
ncbi:hypothetical protein G6F65_015809 [Rhizopus arrhizus]|nr:hypothetical protein G6F65_015809 [Rhizopus arrhizus]